MDRESTPSIFSALSILNTTLLLLLLLHIFCKGALLCTCCQGYILHNFILFSQQEGALLGTADENELLAARGTIFVLCTNKMYLQIHRRATEGQRDDWACDWLACDWLTCDWLTCSGEPDPSVTNSWEHITDFMTLISDGSRCVQCAALEQVGVNLLE